MKIDIYGDKNVKRESAEHIINFPGGYIAVMRTTNGEYWIHIGVNKDLLKDVPHLAKVGEIVETRVDFPFEVAGSNSCRPLMSDFPMADAEHIAVKIKTK